VSLYFILFQLGLHFWKCYTIWSFMWVHYSWC